MPNVLDLLEPPSRLRTVPPARPSIAVLVPCRSEAAAIATVIRGFRAAVPDARIYVYDNRSTDDTAAIAAREGAIVRAEPWPGKGNVVRRMFGDIDADIYLLVDGDATYDPDAAPLMIQRLIHEQLDMVVGARRGVHADAHRAGHAFGNRVFNAIYRRVFGRQFADIFSGYRVLSRRFVKTFPAASSGFEVETEMSVHASQMRMPVVEVETEYRERPHGSSSKLNTWRDALRILAMMTLLCKEVKPAAFFGLMSAAIASAGLALGLPVIDEFRTTGLVPRFPTAILACGLILLAAMSAGCGLILDSVARGRLEQKRFNYLLLPPFGGEHGAR
jgi:hypothetical protein